MNQADTIVCGETANRAAAGTKGRARLITLNINGERHEISVRPRIMLIEVIRETVGLTGTKGSCASGTCGACTVLLSGRPVLSCITLAVECDGKEVRTVEDLAQGGKLSSLQEAFLDQGAVQCGFCTPGMLMSATALLERNDKPSLAQIKKALEGNLCRCTGYNAIVDAVLQASGQGVTPVMK
jgi:aerobic carbon-monoxide dehydrogenase small subunit